MLQIWKSGLLLWIYNRPSSVQELLSELTNTTPPSPPMTHTPTSGFQIPNSNFHKHHSSHFHWDIHYKFRFKKKGCNTHLILFRNFSLSAWEFYIQWIKRENETQIIYIWEALLNLRCIFCRNEEIYHTESEMQLLIFQKIKMNCL